MVHAPFPEPFDGVTRNETPCGWRVLRGNNKFGLENTGGVGIIGQSAEQVGFLMKSDAAVEQAEIAGLTQPRRVGHPPKALRSVMAESRSGDFAPLMMMDFECFCSRSSSSGVRSLPVYMMTGGNA